MLPGRNWCELKTTEIFPEWERPSSFVIPNLSKHLVCWDKRFLSSRFDSFFAFPMNYSFIHSSRYALTDESPLPFLQVSQSPASFSLPRPLKRQLVSHFHPPLLLPRINSTHTSINSSLHFIIIPADPYLKSASKMLHLQLFTSLSSLQAYLVFNEMAMTRTLT